MNEYVFRLEAELATLRPDTPYYWATRRLLRLAKESALTTV